MPLIEKLKSRSRKMPRLTVTLGVATGVSVSDHLSTITGRQVEKSDQTDNRTPQKGVLGFRTATLK